MKNKTIRRVGAVMLMMSLLFMQGCGGKDTVQEYTNAGTSIEDIIYGKLDVSTEEVGESVNSKEQAALDILAEMTLEEKVYQMFIVKPETLTGYDEVNASTSITKGWLEKYPVGGLIYTSSNILEKKQTSEMLHNTTNSAMELQGMPIFLCVDEEGGSIVRVAGNEKMGVTNVGPMNELEDKAAATQAGATIGKYLFELGFNVNLAPVADVLTNEENTVVADRSFGSDPIVVRDYAEAYSDGLHSQNILSTYKHFPGHGATTEDSHKGIAIIEKTYEEMLQSELIPFEDAESADVDFVMVGHISVPNITGDNTPSSLSEKMVTDVLRKDFGYTGLIITDGMEMKAITDNYTTEEATVKAIQAGVDIILKPEDFHASVAAILKAVEDGTITEERINESVLRIIKKKLEIKTQ